MKKCPEGIKSLARLVKLVRKHQSERGKIGKLAREILTVYRRVLKAEEEKEKTMRMLSNLSRHIDAGLASLNPREEKVLRMRFGIKDNMTTI